MFFRGLVVGIISSIIVFVLGLGAIKLLSHFVVAREEIIRVTSPDSIVDAVLIQTNGGATTTFGYNLYIVPTGGKPKEGYEVFIADHLENINLIWKQPKILEIKFTRGRIFRFTNFWQSAEVQNFNYIVEIQLSYPTNKSVL